jgi:hypothetical protein
MRVVNPPSRQLPLINRRTTDLGLGKLLGVHLDVKRLAHIKGPEMPQFMAGGGFRIHLTCVSARFGYVCGTGGQSALWTLEHSALLTTSTINISWLPRSARPTFKPSGHPVLLQ